MEQIWPQLRPKYKLKNPYYKVPQLEVRTGTAVWKRRAYSSERRTVGFGKGRLETQVMLCAGRLLHFIVLCRSREQAELALAWVEETVKALRLALEPSKTSITTFQAGFEYLGCVFKGDSFFFERDGQRIQVRDDEDWEQFYRYGPEGYP